MARIDPTAPIRGPILAAPAAHLLARPRFAGGGELGELTRARDWAATPLGPPETWPQSLVTAVNLVLESGYPMMVIWGRALLQFYNDAYRPILGRTKHPAALGAPVRAIWPEAYDVVGPLLQSVLDTGVPVFLEDLLLPVDRYGFLEETHFGFSYSPIRDESAGVAGVLVTCQETTKQVFAERRLLTLQELASRTVDARTAEEACLRAAAVLGESQADVPFALLYLLEGDGGSARLVAASGVDPGEAIAPATVSLGDAGASGTWPLGDALAGGGPVVVTDLVARFGSVPCAGTPPWNAPPWEAAPTTAMLLPLASGGDRPAGVLVAGTSPRFTHDDAYREFVGLVAGQIAAAVASARAYAEERARAEALAQLDRAKTVFFSNVSHELRTPLTLILGPATELLRSPDTPPAARAPLEVIHRNALRLRKLVNSMLDFARVEAGRAVASYEPTDLARYTAGLASVFRSAVERAGLVLRIEAAPLAEPVFLDRDMWEKIVLNLLSNAFKHTFAGAITVRVGAHDGAARLDVEDTGVGIPAEELARVFERFHRVPNARSRTHEGTGIGLALVQELVRLHGGRIEVASREGVGTRFTVTIPLGSAHLPREGVLRGEAGAAPVTGATDAAAYVEEALRWLPDAEPDVYAGKATPAAARARHPLASTEPAGDPAGPEDSSEAVLAPLVEIPRVLVADDNADMRQYLARLLRAQGWRVVTAPDGLAALQAARLDRPDLVLADGMMPGLDGLALLRALRQDEALRTIPFILLTARAGEEATVEGSQAGADAYLTKPFSAQVLVARVASLLALARERARATAAIAAARDLLARVFEQAPVGLCVMRGPDHALELANSTYQRLFPPGRTILGRPLREVVPEAVEQRYAAILDRVRATGEAWLGRGVELQYDRHGDGRRESAFFNALYHPLHEPDGRIDGIIGVVAEITEEVRARREAEAARQEADDASRAKSQFLAIMSHDLRTPLNAIAGYAELFEAGIFGPVTERQLDAMQRILINDILSFARIEAGNLELEPSELRVAEIIDQVRDLVEPQVRARGLAFECHPGPATARVRADPERLTQILLNLLANAIKFTDAGAIVLGWRVVAGQVAIFARDQGRGIPADRLEEIFQPFVQVSGAGDSTERGVGLGLAISRQLAQAMGGDLTVESELGRGSTFTVLLPEAPARDDAVTAGDAVTSDDAAVSNGPPTRGDAPRPRSGAPADPLRAGRPRHWRSPVEP